MRMLDENGEQEKQNYKDCAASCLLILNNSSFHCHTPYIPGTSLSSHPLSAIWTVFFFLLLLPFVAFTPLSFYLASFSELSCFSQGSSLDLKTSIFLSAQLAFNSSPQFSFVLLFPPSCTHYIHKYNHDDTPKTLRTLKRISHCALARQPIITTHLQDFI